MRNENSKDGGILSTVTGVNPKLWLYLVYLLILIGIFASGLWVGLHHSNTKLSDQIIKLNGQISTYQATAAADKAEYDANLKSWIEKEQFVEAEYANEVLKNQQVVTRTVTQTVVKEVHDHAPAYACPIPASGSQVLTDQANELNAIRGH